MHEIFFFISLVFPLCSSAVSFRFVFFSLVFLLCSSAVSFRFVLLFLFCFLRCFFLFCCFLLLCASCYSSFFPPFLLPLSLYTPFLLLSSLLIFFLALSSLLSPCLLISRLSSYATSSLLSFLFSPSTLLPPGPIPSLSFLPSPPLPPPSLPLLHRPALNVPLHNCSGSTAGSHGVCVIRVRPDTPHLHTPLSHDIPPSSHINLPKVIPSKKREWEEKQSQ